MKLTSNRFKLGVTNELLMNIISKFCKKFSKNKIFSIYENPHSYLLNLKKTDKLQNLKKLSVKL